MDRRRGDPSLRARLLVVGTGGRRREGHKGLRTKAETGKPVSIDRELIAWDVVPLSL
jgi:hypothetical protein